MQDAASSASAEPTPAPTATEIVTRPPPGLRAGKYESPAWGFYVMGGIIVVAALIALSTMLLLRRRAKKSSR